MSVDLAVDGPLMRARSNEPRFEDIVRRHHAKLRRLAAGILVDASSVDDVLQDSYVKAYRSLPARFANEAHEAAWLHRIVYRTCIDELRSRRRRRDEALVDAPAAQLDGAAALDVRRALRALAPEDRGIVLLVDLIGLDYEAAARIVDVPRGTLAWRLSVARGRFRSVLRDEGVIDG